MSRGDIILSAFPERFYSLPITTGNEIPQGDQVPPAFVFLGGQNVQDEALDHRPGRFIPERIVALVDDDKGIGYAARFVNALLAVRIQSVQRVEPASKGFIDLRRLKRVQNMNGLPESWVQVGASPPPPSRNGGVFALGVDHDDRPRPDQERIHNRCGALASPVAANQTDMAVIPV